MSECRRGRTPAQTVSELIALLSKFPGDKQVRAGWEGIATSIDDIFLDRDDCVILDVDGGWGREADQKAKEKRDAIEGKVGDGNAS